MRAWWLFIFGWLMPTVSRGGDDAPSSMFDQARAIDVPRLVEAIRIVENSPAARIGAAGERGPWQMKPATWRMFSARPLWWASSLARDCQAEQRAAAAREVQWIRARLALLELPDTPGAIAVVHNAGYGIVEQRRTLPRHWDFGQRVENVYWDLTQRARRAQR